MDWLNSTHKLKGIADFELCCQQHHKIYELSTRVHVHVHLYSGSKLAVCNKRVEHRNNMPGGWEEGRGGG